MRLAPLTFTFAGLILQSMGCGPAQTTVVASLFLERGLTSSQIQAIDLFVLGDHDKSGAALDCGTLASSDLWSRTDLVYVTEPAFSASLNDIQLKNLNPGTALIVVAQAYATSSGLGVPIGFGCQDGVAIKAGESTSVVLNLAPPS